ncbi:MAG TPA: hypothetical protein VFA98_06585 [Thermoanaerobaculia bacterium]|nr:hypothetical protein [Thermoanaerobaculia bacterium]
MALVEISKGQYIDPEPVESEPECLRMEPDSNAFRNFLLPRVESAHDEACAEVLASVRAGRPFGDAVLDAIESLPASKTKKLRTWVEEARSTRIYAYVEFGGLSRVYYGLMLTAGSARDEVLASEEVGQYELENLAGYWYFSDAAERLGERSTRGTSEFEEQPFVEVSDEEEYDGALEALEIPKDESAWTKPGLYDFRDSPPTFAYSIDEYERESMKDAAERALEDMFNSEEWENVCVTLLEG